MRLLSSFNGREGTDMPSRWTWKREWTWILVIFLGLRVIYSSMGALALSDGPPIPLGADLSLDTAKTQLLADPVSESLVNVWLRWDTAWYIKIAASGYGSGDGSIAFMPLYPWLIRITGTLLGGNLLLGAILVSNLACFISLILLFELARLETGSRIDSMQTVLGILVFPTGFFLFAAYTESLFLMFLLAAWLCARSEHWLAAGLLAVPATLCRVQGALLSPVFIWLYLVSACCGVGLKPLEQIRAVWKMLATPAGRMEARSSLWKPAGLTVFLPVFTLLVHQVWLKLSNLGSFPQTLITHWGIRTVMPWKGFLLFMDRLFTREKVFIDYIDLAVFLLILAVTIFATLRMHPVYALFNVLNLGLFFMRGTPPHLLDSFSRYALILFPAFLVFGTLEKRKVAFIIGSFSFILQLFLLMGFLDWRWVA
jgi:hypothetical protein